LSTELPGRVRQFYRLGIFLILPRRVAVAFFIALFPLHAQPQAWGLDDATVPYVNTPMEIVERVLRMAGVESGDYVIDLGSGDGRIIIEAASAERAASASIMTRG